MKKVCSYCKEEKDLDEFHNDKKTKDGKQYHCIDCGKKLSRDAYQKRKEAGFYKNYKDYHRRNEYGERVNKNSINYVETYMSREEREKLFKKIMSNNELDLFKVSDIIELYQQTSNKAHFRQMNTPAKEIEDMLAYCILKYAHLINN
jgi:hypothetical protein